MKSHLAAALALALWSGSALAQTPTSPPAGAPAFVSAQPAGEWSANVFIGEAVLNSEGERIGDINDLLFDPSGRITMAVIGVGGFLGVGEKNVAVPFSALTVSDGPNGERLLKVPLTKDSLRQAPEFKFRERTTFMKAKDKATELGHKALEKASELKDQAVKKFEEMKKNDSNSKPQ
jgi:hypothetical protein